MYYYITQNCTRDDIEKIYISNLNEKFNRIENLLVKDLDNQKLIFEKSMKKIKSKKLGQGESKSIWKKIKEIKIETGNYHLLRQY